MLEAISGLSFWISFTKFSVWASSGKKMIFKFFEISITLFSEFKSFLSKRKSPGFCITIKKVCSLNFWENLSHSVLHSGI